MNKPIARNAFVARGVWSLSSLLALLLSFLLIPINNRVTFTGDLGIVVMWLWLALPRVFAAAVAALALVWVTETRRPMAWLAGLAALYLYAGVMDAWRHLMRGWHTPPQIADYCGIALDAILPALMCVAIGIWWRKRQAAHVYTVETLTS